jgi:hypothetical protein
MWTWKVILGVQTRDIFWDAFRYMPLPDRSIWVLFHPHSRGTPDFAETTATIPGAGNSVAESDRVASEGNVEIVDVSLAVDFPGGLVGYPTAASETKLGETEQFGVMALGAPIYMLPPVFDGNTKFDLSAAGTMAVVGKNVSYSLIFRLQEGTGQESPMGRNSS